MEIKEIEYKTFESEKIVQVMSWYAITSLIVVSIFMRVWLPKPTQLYSWETAALTVYTVISLSFLYIMGKQSKRRALINKLPSTDILKICEFLKDHTKNKSWHVTYENFNTQSMQIVFGDSISFIIPPHDYLSYMLSERLVVIKAVTDKGSDRLMNPLSIELSGKGHKCLEIYSKSLKW
ncbi:hypothetical protein J7H93_004755 [Vibrio parahaemolyticus]|nr:hypothetical protein [Vibrio parahaemolyticus]EHH1935587.1 hypothetical protein [Vibrio parahaemolyticus]EIU6756924.1 hypothetical protein [Vibrio parahaemolyticus]EIZ1043100.1 hypothetical protein [Vibrio parahaemolyticus]